ncbi:unnamed protein product [Caenorhabditis sp. 36 PRJEB53466]|nr:unnamed protein product [Caenorhabditis sp. 36 PRJEB53466]
MQVQPINNKMSSNAEALAAAFEQDGGPDFATGTGKRTKSDRAEHKHASQPGGDTRKKGEVIRSPRTYRLSQTDCPHRSVPTRNSIHFFSLFVMSRPLGYMGYEFQNEEMFVQQMLEQKRNNLEQEKMLEQQKKMLECKETLPEDEEPVPMKCLDFEEAFRSGDGYESPYKTIPFLKDDVLTVNTMSHCSPDDIAKLIRSIQNSVYTLGMEEARQCRRGKLLNVLKTTETAPRLLQPTPPKIVPPPSKRTEKKQTTDNH